VTEALRATLLAPRRLAHFKKFTPSTVPHNYERGTFFAVHLGTLSIA
jgi:hypothetical protein